MFGRVAKIPIANTVNELVEMDFADYGDLATFLDIGDIFFAISGDSVYERKRKKNKPQKW